MTLGRRVAGALLLSGMLAVSACSGSDSTAEDGTQSVPVIVPGAPGQSNRTLSPAEAADLHPPVEPVAADFRYVESMIGHHRQALEMTELAAAHATGERVRALADRIFDAQGPEIDMMNRWLVEHGKPPVAEGGGHGGHGGHGGTTHAMPGMASEADLERLAGARGADFDRLFLRLMIAHHEGALVMAREAQNAAADVRVQEMADDVIATQAAEIAKMRAMQGS